MDVLILIAISLGAILVLIAGSAIVLGKRQKNNDKQKETNYLPFFCIGNFFSFSGFNFYHFIVYFRFSQCNRISVFGNGFNLYHSWFSKSQYVENDLVDFGFLF